MSDPAHPHTVRIATRKSPLALWQANDVRQQLEKRHPGLTVQLVPMVTQGDRLLDTPLAKIGGKGLFLKELQAALLEDRADLAVHSMKDVPNQFPDGLMLTAICQRADPRDAFVSAQYVSLDALPIGATVGTCSLRRQSQLLGYRPDLNIQPLRGNVGTRLDLLDQGKYDAIILASAGLQRLALSARIRQHLTVQQMLPAVGQGAIGLEIRRSDQPLAALLAPLHHPQTARCVTAERGMNAALNGSCQSAIGGYAEQHGEQIRLQSFVGQANGQKSLKLEESGPAAHAERIGQQLAKRLLAAGAHHLLNQEA